MYRKLCFIAVVFGFICNALYAQKKSEKEDVVYLKNGSVIRGTLVEHTGEQLKIELLGGSIFVFRQSEIDSIKKEDKIAVAHASFQIKQKGYRSIIETGVIFGSKGRQDNNYYGYRQNDYGIQLHTIHGWQFNRFLFAGAGMGIDRFVTYRQNFALFYARVSSDFLKGRVAPFLFTDIGYALFWMSDMNRNSYEYYKNKGGLYVQAGSGIRIFTRSKTSVQIGAAYKRLHSESNWKYSYERSPHYNLKRVYQRVVFLVGVSF